MQSLTKTAAWAVLFAAACGGATTLTSYASTTASPATAPVMKVSVAHTVTAAQAVAALKPAKPPVITLAAAKPLATDDALRSQLKYETVSWGGKKVQTLDEASRVLLAKAAAKQAGLKDVGLSFHDVYGIIEAETSWIPRTGASKDGTANLGLAQFEPKTAAGLGIEDTSDPVQAVFGAAKMMKTGAQWASTKLASLKLSPEQYAAKVREGVSVYYNLSVKGRNKWDGMNTAALPIETQRHISNARAGAAEAAELAKILRA